MIRPARETWDLIMSVSVLHGFGFVRNDTMIQQVCVCRYRDGMSLSDLPESLNIRSPVKISSISVNNNSQDFKTGSDADGRTTTEDGADDLVHLNVIENSGDNKNGDSITAKQRWTMAYRAVRKGSDDGDVFTPDKNNGTTLDILGKLITHF